MISDCSVEHEAQVDPTDLVATLFHHHAQAICTYLHSLLNDWEGAHDLTQETYLRLHQARDRLPGVENQRAWIYRIATNLAFNELKRRKRFAWLPWHKSETAAAFVWHGMETDLHNSATVSQTLALLATDYRTPLLLYSSYGFSVREIAATLDLSESAVKVRLYRARERFRQLYEQEMTDDESSTT